MTRIKVDDSSEYYGAKATKTTVAKKLREKRIPTD